jgi:hypothetical protein
MKCPNVFHVSLLEPTTNNAYAGQNSEPLPTVEIDGEDEYFMEAILDSRIHWRKLQYLMKWVGYDQPDWEPTKFHSQREAINIFYKRYPDTLWPLSTQLWDVTSLELSPNMGILLRPIILKSMIYYIMLEPHMKLQFTMGPNHVASSLIT